MSASLVPPTPVGQAAFPDPIPGIIPFGTLSIFAGAPGVGKTTMMADWFARWRDGRPICGHATTVPTELCYLAADRSWKSHAQWFQKVGYPDVKHYCLGDDRTVDVDRLLHSRNAFDTFLKALDKLNPAKGATVAVDPVSPLFIAGDTKKDRDVCVSLLKIATIIHERLLTLIAIAHFGKQRADPREQYLRPQDRISGSYAFSGYTDTQIYLLDPQPPKVPYSVLGWNPRQNAPEEFHFTRNKTGLFVPYELYDELERRQAALACVPFEPTSVSLVLEAIGKVLKVDDRQAHRYLTTLKQEGQVQRVAKGLYKRAPLH